MNKVLLKWEPYSPSMPRRVARMVLGFQTIRIPSVFFLMEPGQNITKQILKVSPIKNLDKTSGELDEGVRYIERDLPTYICISVVTFLRRSGLNLLIKEFAISGKEKKRVSRKSSFFLFVLTKYLLTYQRALI